jgi:hypothetical protein
MRILINNNQGTQRDWSLFEIGQQTELLREFQMQFGIRMRQGCYTWN